MRTLDMQVTADDNAAFLLLLYLLARLFNEHQELNLYLQFLGLCESQVQALQYVHYERHQVLHDVLVVPVQEMFSHATLR